MQLISTFNKRFRFSLCVIDIFSKYAQIVPLKDKKGASIVNAFQKILKESDGKFKKRKVYSGFKDNIWGDDLADMQLISKFNKRCRFLLWVIDIFSKYAWVTPLKQKKGVSIVNSFQKILDDSNRKPNEIWVDK